MAAASSPFRGDALQGKVAIVTGGGSGICFGITKQVSYSTIDLSSCPSIHNPSTAHQLNINIINTNTNTKFLLHGAAAAVICGRRESFLQKASANLSEISGKQCLYVVCDVRDEQACRSVVDFTMARLGRVDILVNGGKGFRMLHYWFCRWHPYLTERVHQPRGISYRTPQT